MPVKRISLPIGLLYVVSVPFLADVAAMKGFEIAGLRFTGYLWFIFLIVGMLILMIRGKIPITAFSGWAPWFLFVLLSLLWSPMGIRANLQVALQIVTPLVVGLVTVVSIDSEFKWNLVVRGFFLASGIAIIGYIFVLARFGQNTAFDLLSIRAAAMTITVFAAVFVAYFKKGRLFAITGWAICLSIVVLTGSRMATATTLLLWVLAPNIGRFRARLFLAGTTALVGWLLFQTPMFQERFFFSGRGSIDQIGTEDFDSAGRFSLWPEIWDEATKRPFFGSGVGESDRFMKGISGDELAQPHNDYLRVFFEFGIIGFAIFLAAISQEMQQLWRYARALTGEIQFAASAAFLAVAAWMIMSLTDNGLIYGLYFTHPIFVLLGSVRGLDRIKRKKTPKRQGRQVNRNHETRFSKGRINFSYY